MEEYSCVVQCALLYSSIWFMIRTGVVVVPFFEDWLQQAWAVPSSNEAVVEATRLLDCVVSV